MARQVYHHNNVRLSPEQVAQVLYQAGFRDPNAIAMMVSIAERESGFQAGVHGTDSNPANMTGDMGLFQINGGNVKALVEAGVIRSARDLLNPVMNAKAAYYLARGDSMAGVHHNWGVTPGKGWTGTAGTLPSNPNYQAVQNAMKQGLLGKGFIPTSGGGNMIPSPGGGSYGTFGSPQEQTQPIPPETAKTMAALGIDPRDFGMALTPTQIANIGMIGAHTGMQQQYAGQMLGLEQQSIGLGKQQTGFDLAALEAERDYQNSQAYLQGLVSQREWELAQAQFREVSKNVSKLRELEKQGLTNTRDYINQSRDLERDILKATNAFLNKQRGFTNRDFNLAKQAIQNTLKTEAARWSEIQTLTGNERKIAQKRYSDAKNSWAEVQRAVDAERGLSTERYDTSAEIARFNEQRQRRAATSDAIQRSAFSSSGFADTLNELATERDLSITQAQNTLNAEQEALNQQYNQGDLALQRSNTQLQADLENIRQRYATGQITYQDAQRQSQVARQQAVLARDVSLAQLGYQGQQAQQQYRGFNIQANNQMANANLAYRQAMENHRNTLKNAQLQQKAASASKYYGDAARRRASEYRDQMYDINRGGLMLTGQRYGIDAARAGAQYRNTFDNLAYQGAMDIFGTSFNYPDYGGFIAAGYEGGYGGYGGSGGGSGGGSSGGGSTRPSIERPREAVQTAFNRGQNVAI